MARFKGTLKGTRGEVSRLGHKSLVATVNGWNIGVQVSIEINDQGEDEILIYKTGGSNGYRSTELLLTINSAESKLRDALIEGVIFEDA